MMVLYFRKILGASAICAVSAVLSACGGSDISSGLKIPVFDIPSETRAARARRLFAHEQRSEAAVAVAILLPLSHPDKNVARTAQDLLDATQLALFDNNDPKIHLIIKDTYGQPRYARLAARQAIEEEAQILLGPLFGASAKAVARVAGRTPVLTFSNDRSIAGDGVWLLGFAPEENMESIIVETINNGRTRFAALIPETPYGTLVEKTFPALVAKYGGEMVRLAQYPSEPKQMAEPIKQLANYDLRKHAVTDSKERLLARARELLPPDTDPQRAFDILADSAPVLVRAHKALEKADTLGDVPFDAVFIPEGGLALRNIAPLLSYYDIDPRTVKFIGTNLWDDLTLGREPSLLGGWFAAPDPTAWWRFVARFKENYGRQPRRIATLGYDALSLAATLAKLPVRRPFTEEQLTNPNGFRGVDGIFRLTEDGANQRGLAILEIGSRRRVIKTAAPTSFIEFDRVRQSALLRAEQLRQARPEIPDAPSSEPLLEILYRVEEEAEAIQTP